VSKAVIRRIQEVRLRSDGNNGGKISRVNVLSWERLELFRKAAETRRIKALLDVLEKKSEDQSQLKRCINGGFIA
jgi:hypothetical protein